MIPRFLVYAACVAVLLCVSGRTASARVDLDFDGMVRVDGQRTFVLGCYANPGSDEGLADLAEAGFNLVRASASTESLDALAAHGLYGWVPLGGNLNLAVDAEKRRQALTGMVEPLRAHPALMVWESPDEALWNIYYSAFLREHREHPRLREEIEKRKAQGEDVAALEDAWARLDAARSDADREAEAALRGELYALLGEQPPNWPYTVTEAPAQAHIAAEGFLQGYHFLRQLDPDHPLWSNHAPRNTVAALAEFNRACDIVGCDIYPVPERYTGHSDLADRSLASVGAYTERMKAAGEGDPVWMVLQGFGWWDLTSPEDKEKYPEREERGRRPRHDESRFMAYDAIVHGATGVLYWGSHYVETDSEFWADLKRVVRELAVLRPVLEAPTLSWRPRPEIIEDGSSRERGLQIMAKRHEGALYLIVVNEERDGCRFRLHGMDAYEGTAFHRLIEGDTVTVSDGVLADSIGDYGVSIYTDGTALDQEMQAIAGTRE